MDPRLTALYAGKETTYGQAAVLTQAMYAKVTDFAPLDSNLRELDKQQSVYGAQKSLITASWMRLGLEIDVTGSGTAGTAPLYQDLLLACGNAITEDPGVDTQIAPASINHDSITAAYTIDGMKFSMVGARGNVSYSVNAEGHLMAQLTLWGIPVLPLDEPTPDMDLSGFLEPVPVNGDTSAFTFFGYAAVFQSLTVNYGWEIVRRNKPNDIGVYLKNRKVTGNLTIDLPLIAQHDFLADIRNHTTGALSLAIGSTAGNINTLTAPAVQPLGSPTISESEQTVQIGMQVKFLPNSDAGDDEILLTQT
mgnify:CR=1 FL=1